MLGSHLRSLGKFSTSTSLFLTKFACFARDKFRSHCMFALAAGHRNKPVRIYATLPHCDFQVDVLSNLLLVFRIILLHKTYAWTRCAQNNDCTCAHQRLTLHHYVIKHLPFSRAAVSRPLSNIRPRVYGHFLTFEMGKFRRSWLLARHIYSMYLLR